MRLQGAFFENDTIDMLPPEAKTLPPFEQKKLLKTGQQKLMEALEQYRIQANITKNNWHVINNTGRSALITLWTNNRKQVVAFVKLFQSKSLNSVIPFFWSNADFARDTGFAIENVSQQKADLNLKPLTVVGIDSQLSVAELIDQVEVNLPSHTELPDEVIEQIPLLLKNVMSGFSEPIKDSAQYINSYEIDLGETAAPIALMTGHFVSGAYKQVEDQLLKPMGTSWAKIKKCSFPMFGNEQLVDSYLHLKPNVVLAISSKNSTGGATSSITSLTSAIDKNPERYSDLTSQKKYKYLINILNLIKEQSAIDGPLHLGVLYGIIDVSDKKGIKAAIADPNISKKDITKKLQKLLDNKIFAPNQKSLNYMVGYHLLSTVTNLVCEHLNSQEKIVTSFFKEVLSRSNMIQCYTKMKAIGDGAAYSEFQVVWPAKFIGQVKFDCSKNYMASDVSGKIGFKIG